MSYILSPPSRSIIFTTGAHREGLIQGFQEKSSADRTTPRIRKSSSAVLNLIDQPWLLISLLAGCFYWCLSQPICIPEVSGLDLSPLPDNDFDLLAVNQSNWLSAPPFWSLFPKLADIPTAVSKETSETKTTSDTPFQENLADETNLSNFVPRAYIHSTPRRRNGSHTSPPIFLLLSLLSLQVRSLRCLHPHHHPYYLILLPHCSPTFLTPPVYHFGLTRAHKKTLWL